MHTCEFCGAPITGKNRYCSDVCRSKAKSAKFLGKSKKRLPKICADCGASFLGYSRSIRCPECARLYGRKWVADYRKRRSNGEAHQLGSVSHCPICGEPFTLKHGRQLYCPECAKKRPAENASKQYHAHVEIHTRICPSCGKIFTSSNSRRVYCSPECAHKKPLAEARTKIDKPNSINANSSAIAIRRIHLGLTQKQLAQKAGVSRTTIWNYEHGAAVSAHIKQAIEVCLKEENHDAQD